jgi:hypothetical protein
MTTPRNAGSTRTLWEAASAELFRGWSVSPFCPGGVRYIVHCLIRTSLRRQSLAKRRVAQPWQSRVQRRACEVLPRPPMGVQQRPATLARRGMPCSATQAAATPCWTYLSRPSSARRAPPPPLNTHIPGPVSNNTFNSAPGLAVTRRRCRMMLSSGPRAPRPALGVRGMAHCSGVWPLKAFA